MQRWANKIYQSFLFTKPSISEYEPSDADSRLQYFNGLLSGCAQLFGTFQTVQLCDENHTERIDLNSELSELLYKVLCMGKKEDEDSFKSLWTPFAETANQSSKDKIDMLRKFSHRAEEVLMLASGNESYARLFNGLFGFQISHFLRFLCDPKTSFSIYYPELHLVLNSLSVLLRSLNSAGTNDEMVFKYVQKAVNASQQCIIPIMSPLHTCYAVMQKHKGMVPNSDYKYVVFFCNGGLGLEHFTLIADGTLDREHPRFVGMCVMQTTWAGITALCKAIEQNHWTEEIFEATATCLNGTILDKVLDSAVVRPPKFIRLDERELYTGQSPLFLKRSFYNELQLSSNCGIHNLLSAINICEMRAFDLHYPHHALLKYTMLDSLLDELVVLKDDMSSAGIKMEIYNSILSMIVTAKEFDARDLCQSFYVAPNPGLMKIKFLHPLNMTHVPLRTKINPPTDEYGRYFLSHSNYPWESHFAVRVLSFAKLRGWNDWEELEWLSRDQKDEIDNWKTYILKSEIRREKILAHKIRNQKYIASSPAKLAECEGFLEVIPYLLGSGSQKQKEAHQATLEQTPADQLELHRYWYKAVIVSNPSECYAEVAALEACLVERCSREMQFVYLSSFYFKTHVDHTDLNHSDNIASRASTQMEMFWMKRDEKFVELNKDSQLLYIKYLLKNYPDVFNQIVLTPSLENEGAPPRATQDT